MATSVTRSIRNIKSRISRAISLILTILLYGNIIAAAATAPTKEYQIKAVFLLNFTQFVEWPARAFPDSGKPLVVGILGDDPFNTYLDDVVRGEIVQNRSIRIERYHSAEEIKTCHILFVSASEQERFPEILGLVNSKKIFTVGDSEIFSKNGGMMSFVIRSGKIHLQVNLEAVKAANLSISSKLLRLAEVISPGTG